MLQKEGKIRIPAGCAISGIFHKDGTRENGTRIIDSIRTMHDRSNGLGGGFAGYGIYPEYADYYAFHVFYDTPAAKMCIRDRNNITILRHYIDRAFSAKTDNRPEFQNMIKDSGKRLFDMIIVWKLDRFARNRYDSARYKTALKKNRVKVVSVSYTHL